MEYSIIILCLILSAFFSGMEIAFISSNKIYLEIEKKQDNYLSIILTKLTRKPSKFIAAMLVGHNLSLVIYGFLVSNLIVEWIANAGHSYSLFNLILLQTVIAASVILLTAEFLPKIFFQIYANTLIRILSVPAYIFYKIFYYISTFVMWLSDLLLKQFFKTGEDPVHLFFSKVELGNYINEQISTMEDQQEVDSEIQIFQNALEFSNVRARDIMTPRTEISAVEVFDSVTDLRDLFVETGYSKLLVYQNSVDDIVGYVHSFELFKDPKSVKSSMMSVEYVPETIFIKDVMTLLMKRHKNVAVVLDEYGGTSGIITIEDVVEELFGEIEDEHDADEQLIEEMVEDGVYRFSARLDVEYLNEKYKFDIPESDSYGTLGGFIVDTSKEIPQVGEKIVCEKFTFIIEEASRQKIGVVKMTLSE